MVNLRLSRILLVCLVFVTCTYDVGILSLVEGRYTGQCTSWQRYYDFGTGMWLIINETIDREFELTLMELDHVDYGGREFFRDTLNYGIQDSLVYEAYSGPLHQYRLVVFPDEQKSSYYEKHIAPSGEPSGFGIDCCCLIK